MPEARCKSKFSEHFSVTIHCYQTKHSPTLFAGDCAPPGDHCKATPHFHVRAFAIIFASSRQPAGENSFFPFPQPHLSPSLSLSLSLSTSLSFSHSLYRIVVPSHCGLCRGAVPRYITALRLPAAPGCVGGLHYRQPSGPTGRGRGAECGRGGCGGRGVAQLA